MLTRALAMMTVAAAHGPGRVRPNRRELHGVPGGDSSAVPGRDSSAVAATLRQLKARSGSHSPSVGEIERALPGLIEIDACFLSNPYASEELLARMRAIPSATLERIVSHYPAQNASIAASLRPTSASARTHCSWQMARARRSRRCSQQLPARCC